MRELVYVLANGIETKSMSIAKESGQTYAVEMRTVAETKTKISPIRQAMLEQFGYVHPSLKNKVVLD